MFKESKFWITLVIGVIFGIFFGFIAFFVSFFGFGNSNFFGLVDPQQGDYLGPLFIISGFVSLGIFFLSILFTFFIFSLLRNGRKYAVE